jgi:heme-degrading monooxygenase HmoA
MTVIKINAITVAADSGDELARRFAARAGAVDDQDGFEGFELLKPADLRTTWLVVTRWRDEAAFDAWARSPAFGQGHRSGKRAETQVPADSGPTAPSAETVGTVAQATGRAAAQATGSGAAATDSTVAQATGSAAPATGMSRPVGVSSELWSFTVAGGTDFVAPAS